MHLVYITPHGDVEAIDDLDLYRAAQRRHPGHPIGGGGGEFGPSFPGESTRYGPAPDEVVAALRVLLHQR